MRKGIILAGGSGTRLYPVTQVVCKQLLPVYDKPMIYYPLSTLMLAGIRDILIVSTPEDTPIFRKILRDGSQFGINLNYSVQEKPEGLAQAFLIADRDNFLKPRDLSCLILGDNIFYGHDFSKILKRANKRTRGATVFGYYVNDPQRYGVVEFNKGNHAVSIEEKPVNPKSNYAVVGLYFYDRDVVGIARHLKPSARGELEITDLNNEYLRRGKLNVEPLGRGFAWLDTGTHASMNDASNYVKITEDRAGLKVGCIEEVAYKMGYIDGNGLRELAEPLVKSGYGGYLLNLLEKKIF